MDDQRRTGLGYYIAAALLIVLLVGAIGFVVAMVLRPSVDPPQAIVVTDRAPITCPLVDHKDTTCYDTQVTNTGGSEGTFTCGVDAAGDTQATFDDGSTAKLVTIGQNESVHIVTSVTAPGVSPVAAPRVLCSDVTP